MDPIAIIAERKIEEALELGEFDGLPERGRIECSLHGERFIMAWFRERYGSESSSGGAAPTVVFP